MKKQDLEIQMWIRDVDPARAKEIVDAAENGITLAWGNPPDGTSYKLVVAYDGPTRTQEQARRAAREGRR